MNTLTAPRKKIEINNTSIMPEDKPPNPFYNYSLLNMLIQYFRHIFRSNIAIPVRFEHFRFPSNCTMTSQEETTQKITNDPWFFPLNSDYRLSGSQHIYAPQHENRH
jgi:hypothetical protein